MKQEFITLAESIKLRLEIRFSKDKLQNNYIYEELNKIINEWATGKNPSSKTDIGAAAVKLFDSGSKEDDALVQDISYIAKIYGRQKK